VARARRRLGSLLEAPAEASCGTVFDADPERVVAQAVAAGATEAWPVGDEYGRRLGRIVDPFGHEWEIGKLLGAWTASLTGQAPG
jgi:hypothetical protein